ncbi:RGS domain-containing serine/threonine-protein kinase A-like [Bombus affinis]|uniref:RGS domain-containing serine/threonine-protein kinase A-like n=1 Tax=Bombus affinis TaxID=309941 RepID=UPI0021B84B23|nr:RGS domain-containing serine/threonine-protein kinase A-like [Bombus affinis]
MVKRKSLNKLRSRYSSAILNSDTDIFGDEYPYWWKKLEDTSLAQLSTDSKILNETSRHLDSNSQIETSQVTGEWWKILDVSSIPNSPKINKDIVEKNSANNVLVSESEEELEIAKSKHHLRSKTRKSKDNIFLNVLNDSVTTKSDVKKKNNNVITSESEEEPENAKKRYPLRSKAKQNKDNIFFNVLNDSTTTTSEVVLENNNVVTSESEGEPEIAKRKFLLRSKATESNHNVSSNVLNDSVTTKSDVKKKNNNVVTSESEEGSKIAKEKNLLHLRAKRSKGNIFLNVSNDSMTTRSKVIKKNGNIVMSASEEELEIAKSKHHLRSKARESKDNIFLNVLNDSVTSKSDVKNKSNNIITSESEEEPKIAKKRYPLRSKAKQNKDNIFFNVLNDSTTTTSEVTQKNNNVVTSESEEEPEIAKRKFPLRSKAIESKDNIFSNLLNDSVRSKSGTIHETNNVPILESEESKNAKVNYSLRSLATESKDNIGSDKLNDSVTTTPGIAQKTNNILTLESEEPKIAKGKFLSRSKVTGSKDNIFSNVLDDSATTKLNVMQRTGEKSSKSNSASNSETVANVEELNKIRGYSLNHSQKTDDIVKLKSNISKNKNNELQMTTNYLVPAITETSVSSETGSNRFALNFEDDSIHFALPKAQSTILEGSSLSVHNSVKESSNSDAYHKVLKWKSKLLTNHNKNAKKNLFETVFEDQESTIKIRGNATADGIAEHSQKSSKVSEALHLSRLPSSLSKKAISSPSRHSTVVNTNTHSDEPKGQTSIRHFLMSDKTLPTSQMFWDKEKVDGIKRELERVKEREIARMKMDRNKQEVQKKLPSREGKIKEIEKNTKSTLQKQRPIKQVHEAFLVNGRVYRAPRLPRPQPWITDRLYKYLWKCMEPRFKLETRVVSEKFIHQLSSITTLIAKRKSYLNYKAELYALMKEMARLDIIHTRNDFYNFCHDFFPYELRVKTVPMLLPGNKRNIPYDADTLHKPLLVP